MPPSRGARCCRGRALRDVAVLSALILAGVGASLGLATKAGTVGIPHNDAWVYMLGATGLYQSGFIAMSGHSAASVGQLVMVQPLLQLAGGNPWAFTAFGLGMTAIGIAATYLLARSFLGLGSSLLVALLVIVFPGFEREAAGFMTDIPAFALEMLSLLLGVVWLRSERRAALAGSLLVGVAAVSIREFAVVAPVAVLVASLARSRPDNRLRLLLVAGVTAVGLGALLLAVRSPALAGALKIANPSRMIRVGPALTTLAAAVLPAIVLAVGRRLPRLGGGYLIAAWRSSGWRLWCRRADR